MDKHIETRIDQSKITVTIIPFEDTTSSKRARRDHESAVVEELPSRNRDPPDRTPLQWLELGLKNKLLKHDLMEATPEALWKRVIFSDYKCQLSAIKDMRLALGNAFKNPRE